MKTAQKKAGGLSTSGVTLLVGRLERQEVGPE